MNHLGGEQLVRVRQLLANLEHCWSSIPSGSRNDLLRIFLDRITVTRLDGVLRLDLCWITGHQQTIEIDRLHTSPGRQEYWSPAEEEILRECYSGTAWTELLRALPGRTELGIRRRAVLLGLYRAPRNTFERGAVRRFTDEEDEPLRCDAAGKLSFGELRHLTGRATASLRARQKRLALTHSGVRSSQFATWRIVDDGNDYVTGPASHHPRTVAVDALELALNDPAKIERLTELARKARAYECLPLKRLTTC
jgi:hypothetical protein